MSSQIQITGETKVKSLTGVLVGTSGVVSSLNIDGSLGIPQLDVNGKILVSQLPNSVMEYKGTWNAATNSPTLTNGGAFNQGDVYLCDTAGTVNFGAGPITFVVSDQVIYSGSIWQKASGTNGTVTSVGLSTNAGAITIGSSPITTSGTITANFNGTNLQYVNGAGNLTTFPTLITSIGLSMPSAFSVANSPLTANGTIAVTGAGYASQYIRGDGTLADFPSSGGGGSSVSYYLNGGTSQGTIGGTTYYEMSKTAVIGTGVDFTKSGDGFIVAFLTDANDPAQLNIPAGNWNYEIYASMSANGGTPQMYAELYVYDGTTFTLISTSANEILYDGTALNLYTFAMAVPATTLTLTDRLAVKLYATNSGGKTTTIHTQDSHLCQVITTFSTGITALNGLTAQVQYFQVGTSGTDFNISSTTATHTFNIPDASATARGLITTGTQTIAGTKTFSDATKNNGGIFLQNASNNSLAGYMNIGGLTNGVKFTSGGGVSNTFTLPSATGYTFTFPNATGTIALTSDIPSITGLVPYTGATGDVNLGLYSLTSNAIKVIGDNSTYGGTLSIKQSNVTNLIGVGYTELFGKTNRLGISFGAGSIAYLSNSTLTAERTYTLPDASGTLALTSDLTGGTVTSVAALTIGTSGTDLSSTVANSTTTPVITLNVPTASAANRGALSSADWTTFNNKQSALTNPVTGTGTTNTLPKFTAATTIGNSNITDTGTLITLGSNSYVNGNLGLGTTSLSTTMFRISNTFTATITAAIFLDSQASSTATNVNYINTSANTAAATFTVGAIRHISLTQGTFGAGSTVTDQYGIIVNSNLIGATNNYGFFGNIPSGTNRWNLYMNGTASNYMLGNTGVGIIPSYKLDVQDQGIAGILNVSSFSGTGNGGAGRGVGILLGAAGSSSSVQVARLVGYQETASATANNASFAIQVANSSGTLTEYLRVNNIGSVGIGTTSLTGYNLRVNKTITGSTSGIGIASQGAIQSDVSDAAYFSSGASTQAATFTLTDVAHYLANQSALGAGSTITKQYGFRVAGSLTGGTNNYAFFSDIASGTNRWNLYMSGNADNHLAGALGIGATGLTGYNLRVSINPSAATAYGIMQDGLALSSVTTSYHINRTLAQTQAATFTIPELVHYYATQGSFGAGSTVTNQYGFIAGGNLVGATSNFGFYGAINSGTNRWNLYMAGTAANYMAGVLNIGTTTLSGYTLDVNGTGRFSATSTDYALTLQNIQDDSQGLLVRATDNDGSLFLLKLQSSNSSTGQTWVDRFTVAKNGAATFSSSITAADLITSNSGFRTNALNGYVLRDNANSVNLGGLTRRSFWAGGTALDTQIFAETGYSIFINPGGSSSIGLTLASTGAATFSSSVQATSLTSTLGAMEIQGSANAVKTLYINRYGVASGSQHRLRAENAYFEIASANSEPIVLTGGNVGIGTSFVISSYLAGSQTSGVLQVATNVAKTATANSYPVGFFGSNDATYPLGLYIGILTGSATSTRQVKLQGTEIGVSANAIVMQNDGGNVIIGTTSDNGNKLQVLGTGTFSSTVTASAFFESSDSRLKTLIQDNYQTKGIASITPKLYTKNGKVELGYYAQDFVGVLDSAVSKGSDDMLSLSYREVHTAKIYALEQEIKELKAKLN